MQQFDLLYNIQLFIRSNPLLPLLLKLKLPKNNSIYTDDVRLSARSRVVRIGADNQKK